jgi:hypothetical protein
MAELCESVQGLRRRLLSLLAYLVLGAIACPTVGRVLSQSMSRSAVCKEGDAPLYGNSKGDQTDDTHT